MIVQKPPELDPAMRSALKNHIMRKRQQLKQELEQDAIEKRLKREQEAKRKQDAMTLDQLKEQLSYLEKTLDNLKSEKHSLFAQLKQNMRVLNEDDTRRKQKEGEARQQQLQQQQQQQAQQQQQPMQQQPQQPPHLHHPQQQQQPPPPQPPPSQAPILPQLNDQSRLQSQQQQQQQPQSLAPQAQPLQQQQQSAPQQPQLQPVVPTTSIPNHGSLISGNASNSMNNTVNNPNMNNSTNTPSRGNHLPPMKRPLTATNLVTDSSATPVKKIHNPPNSQNQPPPPHPPHQLPSPISNPYLSNPGLPPNINVPNTSGPGSLQTNLFGPNLIRTPPPAPNMGPLFNSPAFSHLLNAQNFARQPSPYIPHLSQPNRPSNPYAASGIGSAFSPLNQPPPPSLISGHGIPNNLNQPNSQNQVPSPLSNPYLSYPGLPPGLSTSASGGPGGLPSSLFNPNLIRTPPPPPNMGSLFNSAAFSHLLNTQHFPRQPPYLPHLTPPNRPTNPAVGLRQQYFANHIGDQQAVAQQSSNLTNDLYHSLRQQAVAASSAFESGYPTPQQQQQGSNQHVGTPRNQLDHLWLFNQPNMLNYPDLFALQQHQAAAAAAAAAAANSKSADQ